MNESIELEGLNALDGLSASNELREFNESVDLEQPEQRCVCLASGELVAGGESIKNSRPLGLVHLLESLSSLSRIVF